MINLGIQKRIHYEQEQDRKNLEKARQITESVEISPTDLLHARIAELEEKTAAQKNIIDRMCFACQARLIKK